MPLTALQERIAALVSGLPEAEGFVLAGGAAMAAHADRDDECEVDIGIDYRALGVVSTRYGPTRELRELAANKVLAIFAARSPGTSSTWPS